MLRLAQNAQAEELEKLLTLGLGLGLQHQLTLIWRMYSWCGLRQPCCKPEFTNVMQYG